MSRPEYGSDLHLWPAKAEVSPLREEPEPILGVWRTDDPVSQEELELAKPLLLELANQGNSRATVYGREYQWQPVARSTDPGTSWEAARSITPEKLRRSQDIILQVLKHYGPLNDERVAGIVSDHMSPSGARTRRSELVAMGLVRDSGRKDTLRSGRRAIVWEAV